MIWQTVLGLEVHAQLKTQSKLFSSAPCAYGASPNSQTSFIDAGFPGVLPVLNEQAVHLAIRFGLAIHADINDYSFFDRKNYFYPDLPKGYQISQFQRPIVSNGYIKLEEGHTVEIVRAHLEEDAGKSIHDKHASLSAIDLNRAGTPLLEIVTAPCLFSAKDAITYLKTLHQLLVFLNICDGNMQEGSFRCDVNLSLRPMGETRLGTRVELKNLNSFRFIEKAILYEAWRQQNLLEQGESILKETRLYNPNTHTTDAIRLKEEENDYRYVPDPDLLPIHIPEKTISGIRVTMPETPEKIRIRLEQEAVLSTEDIEWLLSAPLHLKLFDALSHESMASAKTIIHWLKGPYVALLNEQGFSFDACPIAFDELVRLLNALHQQRIQKHLAKNALLALFNTHCTVEEWINQQSPADNLEEIIREIIAQYPEQAAEYRAGKEKLRTFFIGQIMKKCKGQADPATVHALLNQYLG